MDYKDKYLKYKSKYLELKSLYDNQDGGAKEEEKIRRKYIKKDTPFHDTVNSLYDDILNFLKNNKPEDEYKKLISNLSYMIRNTIRNLKKSKEEFFVISDIVYEQKEEKIAVGSKKLEPYLDAEVFLSKKEGDKYLEADSFKIRL